MKTATWYEIRTPQGWPSALIDAADKKFQSLKKATALIDEYNQRAIDNKRDIMHFAIIECESKLYTSHSGEFRSEHITRKLCMVYPVTMKNVAEYMVQYGAKTAENRIRSFSCEELESKFGITLNVRRIDEIIAAVEKYYGEQVESIEEDEVGFRMVFRPGAVKVEE